VRAIRTRHYIPAQRCRGYADSGRLVGKPHPGITSGLLAIQALLLSDGLNLTDSLMMPLSAGTKLGPYEILALIGAGGMGEVYRARDPRVGRAVAIKVSNERFGERFEREARAIAALNHPNICTLFDVGPNYLVMEYVEGTPLRGPLPLDKVLEYAGQIASALDTAHTNKITHRDLKPANILVTKTGVKLLDFGLAKIDNPVAVDDATVAMGLTAQGTILGTLQYMSPEQVSGIEAGPRSDIFSFGLVLYEMIKGKRAFEATTPASVIGAILERSAPSVADVAPTALDRILKRCLEKDPENRWQTARDLRAALDLVAQASKPAAGLSASRLHSWPWPTLAIAATLATLTLTFLRLSQAPLPEPRTVRFQVPSPEKSNIDYFKLSPDGRLLAFTTDRRLWIRSLDTLESLPLPGTDEANKMFWSPDSQFIAFFAQGKLKKIAASGGPAQTLCNAPEAYGGAWNQAGIIVFPLSLTSGLFQVSASGGTPVPVAKLGASAPTIQQLSPEFLPDGLHFLYSGSGTQGERGIFVGSLDGTQTIRLLPDLGSASYVQAAGAHGQDGYLVFRRGDALMAQRFNPNRLSLSGDASPVAEKVAGSVLWAAFSVSENGTLVYAPPGTGTSAVQMVWLDRIGKQVGSFGPLGTYDDFRLAPDERRITFASSATDNRDVWVLDLVRGVTSRITSDPAIDDPPMWSPDGLRVVWASNRSGAFDLYVKSANGTGPEQLLVTMDAPAGWPEDWSRDGRFIIYQIPGPKTGQDLWIAPQPAQGESGDRKPFPYLQTGFDERHGRFSPDGRWVAYSSNESGRDEIYVQSFPVSGAKFPISAGGGIEPQWRKDGTELFYISDERTLMAVPVKLGSSAAEPLHVGRAKSLFSVPMLDTFIVGRSYEVSNDGQRFLLRSLASGAMPPPLTVVLNWQTQLKR
jgi:eukaryotic-like serine/threonine-protein kinase